MKPPILSRGLVLVLAVLAALGLGGTATSVIVTPDSGWAALLTASFYFVTLGLGGVVFLALMYVANAGWSVVLRRVPEALAGALPVGALGLVVLLLGLPELYQWAADSHSLHGGKGAYLNIPFFSARMLGILAVWLAAAWFLRRSSRLQDGDGKLSRTRANVAVSALFLALFGITLTIASFDWLMSLEVHWFSTIYGFYNIAGVLTAGTAAIAVLSIHLMRRGLLPGMTEEHVHDLGKLLFGFTTLWAYLWLSQYLLIWYANVPEETTWYLRRTQGGWGFLFWLNLVVGWFLPFIALLPRPTKRSPEHVSIVAMVVLAGRWLDIYLMVSPAASPGHHGIGLPEASAFVGLGALFLLAVARALGGAALVPTRDPYLTETLHHRSTS